MQKKSHEAQVRPVHTRQHQKRISIKTTGNEHWVLLIFVLSFLVSFEYSFIGILPMAFINFRDKYFRKAVK
jgi:hypothetical protein